MSASIGPTLLRQMNERRVLEVIQDRGPSSRADVTRYSGISAPTVSKAASNLLERGLLEEGEVAEASLGRPGKVLSLASQAAQVLGVVLDARVCSVVTAGLDGKLQDGGRRKLHTPGTYAGLIDGLVEQIEQLIAQRDVTTLAIGISTPGLISRSDQPVVFSPNLHMTDGHSPAYDLSQRLGIECVVIQESHGLCLAERFYGRAKQLDDFAMLDVSTGLGMGVMSRGQVLTGHSGMAGELGHITIDPQGPLCGCGNHGCLETLATDSAIALAVSEHLGRDVGIEEVVALGRSGQLSWHGELERTLEYLSIAMAAIINIFNPATLFLHGRILDIQDDVLPRLLSMTRIRSLAPSFEDCRIERAQATKQQGAVACAADHLIKSFGPKLG